MRDFSLGSWTVALNPTLLMVGIGGLIGFRACLSLILGAGLGYLLIAPPLVERGDLPLTTHEVLHSSPADFELLTTPEANPRFNPARHRLEWRGEMTPDEHASLRAASTDPRYAEAVDKLYVRSQIGLSESERGRLADELAVTTTRDVQVSEPLADYPAGFVMPVQWEDLVHRDRDRGRLVVVGNMTTAARDDIHRAVAQHESRYGASPATRALHQAVDRLHERARDRYLPDDLPGLPASVQSFLSYDPIGHTLMLSGVPTSAQAAALRDLSTDPDFGQTIDGILAGASLTPVQPSFGDLNRWLLWPGVVLMVVASFVSFGFSVRELLRARRARSQDAGAGAEPRDTIAADTSLGEVGMRWFLLSVSLALVLSVALQHKLFGIGVLVAVAAVLISFLLAVVAARVSGETAITPVGAMGKVSQLVFGALVPGNAATNLMTANVTGGSASQCADLLHDLKCGWLLGAQSRWQMVAQVFGALSGAIAGSAIYLLMIPSPAEQLLTTEWPAPAVAAWKAVAELFQVGFAALPTGAGLAMLVALLAGIILPVLEQFVPRKYGLMVPSAASVGLALIIPASYSVNMFLGGLLALLVTRFARTWSQRFLVTACAGIVAGESITGVAEAVSSVLQDYL